MIGFLDAIDRKLFLILNGWHSPFFDMIMSGFSHRTLWIPLYLFLAWLLYLRYKKKFWLVMLFTALLITLSDQVSVHLFKNVFQRLRPCHDPSLAGMVYTLGRCGGKYGFISSHASNSFAMAIFVVLLLRTYYRPGIYLILVWASLVAYSRVYLGVHFPGDVLVGGIIGALEAILIYQVWKITMRYAFKSETSA